MVFLTLFQAAKHRLPGFSHEIEAQAGAASGRLRDHGVNAAYIPAMIRPGSIIIRSMIALSILFGATTTLAANPLSPRATAETPHVSAALIADKRRVAPGDTVEMALVQEIIPGWHTYWENPGDSGQKTDIAWTLPAGVTAKPIRWAAPERVPYGPLVNYGYHDEVTLLSTLEVGEDWPAGTPLPVRAEVTWLVCEEICIPETVSFAFDLPTGPQSQPAIGVAQLFADAEAALPHPLPWPAEIAAGDGVGTLYVAAPEISARALEDTYFFPASWGIADHAAPQEVLPADGGFAIRFATGDKPVAGPVEGVLSFTDRTGGEAIAHSFSLTATPDPAVAARVSQPAAAGLSLPLALAFAFLGGLILNLMPCVFPILAMKALSLAAHAHADRDARAADGLAYAAGIVVSFAGLGLALFLLKSGGAAAGWGFQLQQPVVVALLAYVLFAVGLNLSGVFHVGSGVAGIGSGLAGRPGTSGSFFTGVLATVVAAPCTAPFMAAALGAALTLSAPAALAVFATLGLGLASPYLLLSLIPAAGRLLPKPGAWMETFKQVLAFPMYGAALWLVWVLAQQVSPNGLMLALGGLLLIAFAAWAYGKGAGSLAGRGFAAAGVLAAALLLLPLWGPTPARMDADIVPADGPAETFTPARLDALLEEGRPVFLNMTAAWCITCKVNERVALSGSAFDDALKATGTAYLKGDWTNQDPAITRLLEAFGRAGVPLYVVYPAEGGEPRLLPQILTEGLVISALKKAAG